MRARRRSRSPPERWRSLTRKQTFTGRGERFPRCPCSLARSWELRSLIVGERAEVGEVAFALPLPRPFRFAIGNAYARRLHEQRRARTEGGYVMRRHHRHRQGECRFSLGGRVVARPEQRASAQLELQSEQVFVSAGGVGAPRKLPPPDGLVVRVLHRLERIVRHAENDGVATCLRNLDKEVNQRDECRQVFDHLEARDAALVGRFRQ